MGLSAEWTSFLFNGSEASSFKSLQERTFYQTKVTRFILAKKTVFLIKSDGETMKIYKIVDEETASYTKRLWISVLQVFFLHENLR